MFFPISAAHQPDYQEEGWERPHYRRLVCPVCQFDFTHPGAASGAAESDTYYGEQETHEGGWPGRGGLMSIPVVGECGHEWVIKIGHHKGQSFIWVEVTKAFVEREDWEEMDEDDDEAEYDYEIPG